MTHRHPERACLRQRPMEEAQCCLCFQGDKENLKARSIFPFNFQWESTFPQTSNCFFKETAIELTNYSLSIFCSEANNLHLHIGSTDWSQHFLHLVPHTEHRAAQNKVRPTPKTDLTLQTHRRFLTVAPPVSRKQKTAEFKTLTTEDVSSHVLNLLRLQLRNWRKYINTIYKEISVVQENTKIN